VAVTVTRYVSTETVKVKVECYLEGTGGAIWQLGSCKIGNSGRLAAPN
jgi:hypothetical protein